MYANTCWGLLGLAVTFGLAVLGLPSQYEWLQPWLLGTAGACGLGSAVCFGWPLRKRANRVKLRELCTHPYRFAKLMEPSHVIILGLVIALSGVIWQMKSARFASVEAPSNKPAPVVAPPLSDFGWGFERYPGYDFIGMSIGDDGQLLVHQFQAQGHNNTKDPIVKASGAVRSDRTNKEFPILFNLADGKYLKSDRLNPIPVDAIIDTRAYFSDDEKPIPLKQFLSDFVPFTFIFDYDGKTYRRRFTLVDIEPRIQRYEQDMRKMSVKPPQMSAKNYFPTEKTDLGNLYSAIRARLNKEGLDAANQGYRFGSDIPETKEGISELMKRVDVTRGLINTMTKEIWEGLVAANPTYTDELTRIVGSNSPDNLPVSPFRRALDTFHRNLSVFEARYDSLDNENRVIMSDLIRQNSGQTLHDTADSFRAWIKQCGDRIDAQRDILR